MSDQNSPYKDLFSSVMLELSKTRKQANLRTFGTMGFVLFLMIFNGVYNHFQSLKYGVPSGEGYVAMVRLRGAIESGSSASVEQMESQLTKAFRDEDAKGVLVMVNSPGGSPVQSRMLYDVVEELKEETGKKVVFYGEDSMASGAYMTALSGDAIYANASTLTGSIGVVQQKYGYVELLNRIGVESRIIQAGEHKVRLNPYESTKPEDIEKLKHTMSVIHTEFIGLVKKSRGTKLAENSDLFSGDFWTGQEAVGLGLIDGVASVRSVIENEFGVKFVKDFSTPRSIFQRFGLNSVLSAIADVNYEVSGSQLKLILSY